tara:strand:- start:18 stop:608 length:591 start_codon:yes stop_codon:yes gene_type:complete
MGAYSPSRLITEELDKKIMTKIIEPTINGLEKIGIKYKGFLYAGLMIVNNEPYLIEYNVRMGDPECQTILPKLKSNLLEIFLLCCDEKLSTTKIEWLNKKSLCVVLCSKGYPDKFEKNLLIKDINKIKFDKNEYCYHASTTLKKEQIYATGGRVLNFVCLSDDFLKARIKITNSICSLNWNGGFYRKDIGYKVINE